MRTIQSKGQGGTVITGINCLGLLLGSVFSAKHMYGSPLLHEKERKEELKRIYNANETENRACAVKLVWPYCIYYMLLYWWKPCRFAGRGVVHAEILVKKAGMRPRRLRKCDWSMLDRRVELENNASYVEFIIIIIIIWATWWSGPGCCSSKSSLFIFDRGLNLPWDVQGV